MNVDPFTAENEIAAYDIPFTDHELARIEANYDMTVWEMNEHFEDEDKEVTDEVDAMYTEISDLKRDVLIEMLTPDDTMDRVVLASCCLTQKVVPDELLEMTIREFGKLDALDQQEQFGVPDHPLEDLNDIVELAGVRRDQPNNPIHERVHPPEVLTVADD